MSSPSTESVTKLLDKLGINRIDILPALTKSEESVESYEDFTHLLMKQYYQRFKATAEANVPTELNSVLVLELRRRTMVFIRAVQEAVQITTIFDVGAWADGVRSALLKLEHWVYILQDSDRSEQVARILKRSGAMEPQTQRLHERITDPKLRRDYKKMGMELENLEAKFAHRFLIEFGKAEKKAKKEAKKEAEKKKAEKKKAEKKKVEKKAKKEGEKAGEKHTEKDTEKRNFFVHPLSTFGTT